MPGIAASWSDIDPFVAELERRFEESPAPNVATLLPPRSHPHYLAILTELLRVDLELCWGRGIERTVSEYIATFPEVRDSQSLIQLIAFEEYRARRQNGLEPSPDSFRIRYKIDTSSWPTGTESHPSHVRSGTIDERSHIETVHIPNQRLISDAVPSRLTQSNTSLIDSDFDLDLDDDSTHRLGEALAILEKDFTTFQGYQILREIGRGAFARVFLAKQPDLAGRLVVLKIAADLRGEPQTLSRLQHANIMPIYAIHNTGPLQAFLMPYFGSTTFADLLRDLRKLPAPPELGRWIQEVLVRRKTDTEAEAEPVPISLNHLANQSYYDAVLTLLVKLSDGLACAHSRGILHLDLKPANILLADDGEPMLLDFNLAKDSAFRDRVSIAYIGGTLPYMSPERLRSFQQGIRHETPQDDIYSFGLIAGELLTGQPQLTLKPGPVAEVIAKLIELRSHAPASVRSIHSAIAPGLASIVAKCLDRDPAKRYPNAIELADDLRRQLTHQPLRCASNPSVQELVRKWCRRHPRLSSVSSIGVVAMTILMLAGVFVVGKTRQWETTRQRNNLLEFRTEYELTRLLLSGPVADPRETRSALHLARNAMQRFPLQESSRIEPKSVHRLNGNEQLELHNQLFDLYLLASRGERIAAYQNASRREESFMEAERFNRIAEALADTDEGRLLAAMQRTTLKAPRSHASLQHLRPNPSANDSPRFLRTAAAEAIQRKQYEEAEKLLTTATIRDPADPVGWYLLGHVHDHSKRSHEAMACYSALVALRPTSAIAQYRLAAAYAESKRWSRAIEYYDQALSLDSEYVPAILDRGLAKLAANDLRGAESDFTHVLNFPNAPTRTYFLRSSVRAKLRDLEGAKADRIEGLTRVPNDESSWISRGVQKLAAAPKDSIADFDAALELNPHSTAALQNKAHALSERLGDAIQAIAVLDIALEREPDHALVRAGRAVLHARLYHREKAHADIQQAMKNSQEPAIIYQGACVYALTSRDTLGDRAEALKLLAAAVKSGFGQKMLKTDPDLDPLRSTPEFVKLLPN